MWRFKYLLIGMLISGAIGAALFFVGRYVYDEFTSELEQDAVAAVEDYFATHEPGPITEERVVISERELTEALRLADEGSSAFDEEGLEIDLVPGEIRIVDRSSNGNSTNLASVEPTVVNGAIELGEPSGVVAIFVSMNTFADEIESQLLSYFNENQVIPRSIEVTDRELIILVDPKPGTTLGGSPVATPRTGTTPTAADEATATPTPRVSPTATRPSVTATPAATNPTPTATRPGFPAGSGVRTPTRTPTPTT